MNWTITIFAVLIVFLSVCNASGQNKKQVILSDKVGTVINESERKQYQLFPKIKGFTEARFYLDTNGSYFSNILFTNDDEIKKDTIIYYTEKNIIRFAEQIQFFDKIQNGNHNFGDITSTITAKDDMVFIVLKEEIGKQNRDILIHHRYYEFPKLKHQSENNPDFGLGFSMAYTDIDFSPITSYVDYAENYLISQDFEVNKHDLSLQSSPVIIFNAYLNIYKGFGLSAEIGLRKISEYSDFHYSSLYLEYCFKLKKLDWLYPYITIGVTSCGYKISFHYNDYRRGSSEYLEEIKSEGGAYGLIINCGVDMRIIDITGKAFLALDVFGKYALMRQQESEYQGYKTTLKLSNISIGAGFKIYY